jgi:hypothetical protein
VCCVVIDCFTPTSWIVNPSLHLDHFFPIPSIHVRMQVQLQNAQLTKVTMCINVRGEPAVSVL